MGKLIFIVNSLAGRAHQSGQILKRLQSQNWNRPCEFWMSHSTEQMDAYCDIIKPEECESVVLVGGDGTMNRALESLASKQIPLGFVPAGTANDLVRELYHDFQWPTLAKYVRQRSLRRIDMVTVNGKPFLTVGGIGVGSVLTEHFNQQRWSSKFYNWMKDQLGEKIYTVLAIQSLLFSRVPALPIRIKTAQTEHQFDVAAVFVCNQPTLGGDLRVAPDAKNNDGLLDVLVILHQPRFRLLNVLKALKQGEEPVGCFRLRTARLQIESLTSQPIKAFGDGEALVESRLLDFRIQPQALQVYAPPLSASIEKSA